MEHIHQHPDPSLGPCSVQRICDCFGLSRQSHYKYRKAEERAELLEELILFQVKQIRKHQPRAGTRKIFHMLKKNYPDLMTDIGRDKLNDLLRRTGFLVKPRKAFVVYTTHSRHWLKKYSNLILGLEPEYPGHILVADITYIRTRNSFVYLALVTDLYSRKIIGYDVSISLSMEGSIRALRMALEQIPQDQLTIHHSDRGVQYCSHAYTSLIEQERGGRMSMTTDGNVYENAVAERVNGILKGDFYLDLEFINLRDAQRAVGEAIRIYNDLRPHESIGMQTPTERFTQYRTAA
jgi:putative transposase